MHVKRKKNVWKIVSCFIKIDKTCVVTREIFRAIQKYLFKKMNFDFIGACVEGNSRSKLEKGEVLDMVMYKSWIKINER